VRRPLALIAACALVLALHEAALRAAFGPSGVGAIALLLAARLAAIVVVPGAALAAFAMIAAHLVRRGERRRDGQCEGSSSGAGISVELGGGPASDARGTK
jgi:hypothetical protein